MRNLDYAVYTIRWKDISFIQLKLVMEIQPVENAHLSDFPAVDNVGLWREVIQVVIEDAAQGCKV